MSTTAATFSLALQHHQTGNLDLAEPLYRRILEAEPDHANAHHLLGAVAFQRGRFDDAVTSIRRAIALNPRAAAYHSNLGLALQAQGRLEEAVAAFHEALRLEPNAPVALSNLAGAYFRLGKKDLAVHHYRQALTLQPALVDAHLGLGNALLQQGQLEEAVASFRQVLSSEPNNAEAHCNLGTALFRLDKFAEASECFREVLRIVPGSAQAWTYLGRALEQQGCLKEASRCYRQAIQLNPRHAEAHCNLGYVLLQMSRPEEAAECFNHAISINPSFAAAHNRLGYALVRLGKLPEAVNCYREALRLNPDFADAYSNLGSALLSQTQFEEARDSFERALQLAPDSAVAHWQRSRLRLLRGDFRQGWLDYEWRWSLPEVTRRDFPQPPWDGSALNRRTILLYAEQGLGDTIQFVRYAGLVKQRGGRVVVHCQAPLLRLLQNASGFDRLTMPDLPLPAFDAHAALLSLPRIFGTSLTTIPRAIPYLHADPALVQHWRSELKGRGGLKVGIAWQGNADYRYDRQRSIPLVQFAPLAQVRGVHLVSLQKGPGTEKLRDLAGLFPVLDLGSRLDESSGPFMDTVALMKNVDLVICSDSVVAHLAGALGVPVWMALPLVPDWRWLLERDDSPWYSSMRLFRQKRFGQWEDVFDGMALELDALLGGW